MRSTSEHTSIYFCILSGILGFVRCIDESTIIIPDPARLAREINSAQSSWVAHDYYERPVTYGDIKERLGARFQRGTIYKTGASISSSLNVATSSGIGFTSNIDKIADENLHFLLPTIPKNLDLRRYYPSCKSLRSIRDQSQCGSCWAVSSASAFSDRLCIASAGRINVHISAESLVTCCKSCGDGCEGGQPEATFKHFTENGEITGGDYGSGEGCKPYSISPEAGTDSMDIDTSGTKTCADKCTNDKYPIPIEKEKRYKTRNYYSFNGKNITYIQWDLMLNGPQVASFVVYSDFSLYKSGVYRHVKGLNAGLHAVRLIGWGRQNGVDYWLAANSWGAKWGERGTFKIRRGGNECLMEEAITSGEVDLSNVNL